MIPVMCGVLCKSALALALGRRVCQMCKCKKRAVIFGTDQTCIKGPYCTYGLKYCGFSCPVPVGMSFMISLNMHKRNFTHLEKQIWIWSSRQLCAGKC